MVVEVVVVLADAGGAVVDGAGLTTSGLALADAGCCDESLPALTGATGRSTLSGPASVDLARESSTRKCTAPVVSDERTNSPKPAGTGKHRRALVR